MKSKTFLTGLRCLFFVMGALVLQFFHFWLVASVSLRSC